MKLDEILDSYLSRNDWNYMWQREHNCFAFGFEGHNGKIICSLTVKDNEQIMFYSTYTKNIAPEHLDEVIHFITKENYKLIIGNFEIDLNDGELNYKTSVDMYGRDYMSDEEISNLINPNLSTMDRNLKIFDKITGHNSNLPSLDFNESDIRQWKKNMERFE